MIGSGDTVFQNAILEIPGDLLAVGEQTDIRFSITNSANLLTASSLIVSELEFVSDSSEFELVGYDPSALPVEILPAGAEGGMKAFQFTVRFHKISAYPPSAQIQIAMLHVKPNLYRFQLAEMPQPPKLVFEPALTFLHHDLSQTISKNIELFNFGVGTLKIAGLKFKADAELTIADNACALPGEPTGTAALPAKLTIKPGQWHQFCVTFVRTDQKVKSGNLTFQCNDPAQPSVVVKVVTEM